MKNPNTILFITALAVITFMTILFYLEKTEEAPKFISFTDGSIVCNTIEIKRGMTKEQLSVALKMGSNYISGKYGDRPGCVNYEFVNADAE